jgi:hypothetical protein
MKLGATSRLARVARLAGVPDSDTSVRIAEHRNGIRPWTSPCS